MNLSSSIRLARQARWFRDRMKRFRPGKFGWRNLFGSQASQPRLSGTATAYVTLIGPKPKPRSWSQKFYCASERSKRHAHVKMGPIVWDNAEPGERHG